jgi:hypothetical protein
MRIAAAASLTIFLFTTPVAVAAPQLEGSNGSRRQVEAARTPRPPVIDGRIDDEVWELARPISGFTQRDPDEGEPATQNTVVRILYDDDAIYVAARLDDTGQITAPLSRRDNSGQSDWFRLYLDPHLDRKSGAAFWVNPANVQVDMVLFNDTWDDWSWDAVWASATTIDAGGWSVEMRIPYSQLRFPDRERHVWGVDFHRRIARNNETSRLVHTPKIESGFVSRFADLSGIEGIRPKSGFEALPYAVTRSDFRSTVVPGDPYTSSTELGANVGLDLKYGLTSNLTLTGTINPDFGQVEVDPARVNLTQFELFFPEKRPFFVEGSNLFDFGRGGGSSHNFGFNFSQPSFFYSRRIGRQPQASSHLGFDFASVPTETTILGAAKLTGKTGNGWTIAILDAITEKEKATILHNGTESTHTVEPMSNYLVTRIARPLGTKGGTGILFTAVNRDLEEDLTFLRSAAYSGGIDGFWAFGNRDVILEWFVGGSRVEGSTEAISATQRSAARYYHRPDADHVDFDADRTSLSGLAGRVMLAKQTGRWRYNLQAQSYTPGFETNDIGFLQRSDITATHAAILYSNQERTPRTRNRNFWVAKYQNWNHAGDLLADGFFSNGSIGFTNDFYVFANAGAFGDRYDDRATRGGPVMRRLGGWDTTAGFGRDARKKFFYEAWTGVGETDEGGSSHHFGTSLGFRPTPSMTLRLTPNYSSSRTAAQYVRTIAAPAMSATYGARYIFAELDQSTFELATRLDWTFTSRLSLQLYMQPFVSSGGYSGFKQLARPRSAEYHLFGHDQGTISYDDRTGRYTIDPDGNGSGIFSFANPDFNYRSLRGSAVMRWEFRPGSALFLVWNENRQDVEQFGDFRPRRDLSALSSAKADNVLMLKMSYWLPM